VFFHHLCRKRTFCDEWQFFYRPRALSLTSHSVTTWATFLVPMALSFQVLQTDSDKSWEVKRHSAWCIGLVSCSRGCYLHVTGWRTKNHRSASPAWCLKESLYHFIPGQQGEPVPQRNIHHPWLHHRQINKNYILYYYCNYCIRLTAFFPRQPG